MAYGCYHDFFYESSNGRRFEVGVEVLMCSDGYQFRAINASVQSNPIFFPLRKCPMRKNRSGERKPVISQIEKQIKEFLEQLPTRSELLALGNKKK